MNYVSIRDVIARLGRNHKRLQADMEDIAMWCYEVVSEYGVFEGFEPFNVRVEVKTGRAKLPCNIYKVDSVKSGGVDCRSSGISWHVQEGCVILPNTASFSSVDILGLAFKVDEEGYPLIPSSLVIPCYWYCLSNMLLDSTYSGGSPPFVLQDARQQFQDTLATAKGSLQSVSQQDMVRVSRMLRSWFPGQVPLQ